FLDDGQRAVPVRAKRFHRVRIKSRTVTAAGKRERGDDLAIDGTKYDTRGRAAVSAPTHREKDVVLDINGQARRSAALWTQVKMPGHFHGFGVNHGDVLLIG